MNRCRRRLILFENSSKKTRKIRKDSNSSRTHGGGDNSLFASPPPFTLALAETRLCKTLARHSSFPVVFPPPSAPVRVIARNLCRRRDLRPPGSRGVAILFPGRIARTTALAAISSTG